MVLLWVVLLFHLDFRLLAFVVFGHVVKRGVGGSK